MPSLHSRTQYPLACLKRELVHQRANRLSVHFDQEVCQHGKVASVRPGQWWHVELAEDDVAVVGRVAALQVQVPAQPGPATQCSAQ